MIFIFSMFDKIKKLITVFRIYSHYIGHALVETYLYYISPFPFLILMKKLSLANRKINILFSKNPKGRKPLEQKTIDLLLEMKQLNPTWGAQRISDELSKIGYKASKKTVLKYLEIFGLNSPISKNTLSWYEFLNNHKFKIGIDFTSLISLFGHQLFIFVMIDLDTRKLLLINATFNPNSEWIKQQFRNAFYDLDKYPTLCICDRDQIFSGWFFKMMDDYFQIKVRQTPYRSPEENGVTERFHYSLKTEAFKNIVPITLGHTIKICKEYQIYYNKHRPHQGISGKIPEKFNENSALAKVPFRKIEHLGGTIVSFEPNFKVAA
jgi:putative transposase